MTGGDGTVSAPGERVAAVVVTYNPGERFAALMAALRYQVGAVWVIDNGSREPVLARVQALQGGAPAGADVNLILNPENPGLAAAQNQGITAAMGAGFDWVLLMDHDSVPDAGMVSELLAAARADPCPSEIGFLAPRHDDERGLPAAMVYSRGSHGLLRRRAIEPGQVEENAAFAMASGCLIPMTSILAVGPMNEDLFIDYIDYDFSFRMRRAGYRIIVVGAARLSHNLGEARVGRFLGLERSYHKHVPDRRYTIYRNRVRVLLSGGWRFPEFVQFEILSICKDLMQLLLFEERAGKWASFRAILGGFLDGIRRRGGPRKS